MKPFRRIIYSILIVVIIFLSWHTYRSYASVQTFKQIQSKINISATTPKKAPYFTLTDQNGKKITLTDFKNKKIVIQPMDPKCTDICPLVSQEIIGANNILGSSSKNVVYIAFNVNEYHNSVQDVKAFSDQHGLSKLRNWYFVTGSKADLQKVWKDYGISVIPNKTGDVQHTSALFFVNTQGNEVYLGLPQNDKLSVNEWSKAISYVVNKIS